MFINFDEVSIYKSIGINYFDSSEMEAAGFYGLFNQWVGENGASTRCHIVHIGKRLEGNRNRLRIAVYQVDNRFDTLVLFPISMIEEAVQTMYSMESGNPLVCVE